MRLYELFDSEININWNADKTYGTFSLNHKIYAIEFMRDDLTPNSWAYAFKLIDVDGEEWDSYSNTGTGDAFEVFGIVINVLMEFLKDKRPYTVRIESSSQLKDKVYSRMFKSFSKKLNNIGYEVLINDTDYIYDYLITRSDKNLDFDDLGFRPFN